MDVTFGLDKLLLLLYLLFTNELGRYAVTSQNALLVEQASNIKTSKYVVNT